MIESRQVIRPEGLKVRESPNLLLLCSPSSPNDSPQRPRHILCVRKLAQYSDDMMIIKF